MYWIAEMSEHKCVVYSHVHAVEIVSVQVPTGEGGRKTVKK